MASATLNTWQDISTVCFGLIITKRLDLTKFHPTQFVQPYEDGLMAWKKSPDITRVTEIITNNMYEAALLAASTVSDASEVEWHRILQKAANSYRQGDKMETVGKALKMGKEVNPEKLMEIAQGVKDIAAPGSIGLRPASEVDISEFDPFVETGYLPIDLNFGGISKTRPTIVGGDSGFGKTSITQRIASCWLDKYKEDTVAVYSFELADQAWKYKATKLFPSLIPNMDRLLINTNHMTLIDIQLELAASGAKLCILDDVSYVVKKGDPQSYLEAAIDLNTICRTLKIPLLAVSQFNSQRNGGKAPTRGSFYQGGPLVDKAGLVLALYRADDDECLEDRYAYLPDYPMMILGLKSGDGWIKQEGPGAVCLPQVKNLWANEPGVWQKEGSAKREYKSIKRGS